MYDRAARITSKPSGSTDPKVGPGTYNHLDQNRGKVSYAPFQSMAVRESFLTVNDTLAAAPGPGHYTLEAGTGFGSDKGKGPLHSKAERFPPPPSKTPGPGSYTVSKESDWIRNTYPPPEAIEVPRSVSFHNRDMLRVGHVMFHRQQTAPSIPMAGQNYGYEESDDGRLKPQLVPAADSSMGPAYYNVSYGETRSTRNYKGVHFGNQKSYRTQFRGAEGPGPGDYDPSQIIKVKPSDSRAQALANIPRYHELVTKLEEKKAVPGPGQYEIKSQFVKRAPLAEEETEDGDTGGTRKAPFGSSLQRFLSPKSNSPASTSYEDPRTAFESTKRLAPMSKAPFGQTSSRFKADRHARFLPGPGAYNDNHATSMTTELAKRSIINGVHQHPFGTTSVRTVPLVKKDDLHMPGPADYLKQDPSSEEVDPESTHLMKATQRPKNSSMFSSTSKRLYVPPAIVADIPPPGSYEVSDSYSKSQGRLDINARVISNTFLSTSERFAPPRDILFGEPDSANPGPGEYDSQGSLGLGKGGRICCKDDRFKDHNRQVPGPGTYQLSEAQRNTVLKGTFNSTLDNPLASNKVHSNRKRVLGGV
ncbi:sperm-tail PG-rich repeat-containing protein 2-like isoform X2 [Halichondria panicea]|uniref:sperm-tail PG-rich repeat-containing protein 2-like isoform X2 n=1 Tax=Halichondria panicea TaxID=6063 RepID=UPI00312B6492